jgi:hypothetical protein
VDAALTREHLLSLRPPVVELTLPGYERISFRTLAARDLDSLIARLDLPPVEFAVETLVSQAEGLPDAAAVLFQLPRQTLLRLVRSWAAHPNTFSASPSQIRKFSDFKLIAQSRVAEFLRPMRELGERLADQLSQHLAGQFSFFSAETEKILATIAEFDRQLTVKLTRSMNALAASFDSAASKLEDDGRKLGERGWTMPMWGPIELVHDLAQLSAQDLDANLQREYSFRRNKRERELLAGLIDKPALLHWRPLLCECIDVFRKRKYRVVVPSLFTVVEGAIASAINLYSRISPKEVAAQIVRTHNPGVIRLAWVSVQAFAGEVFLSRDFSASKPALINRHWICHGRDVPDWSKIDCLRLFQALDTIAAIIGPRQANARHAP